MNSADGILINKLIIYLLVKKKNTKLKENRFLFKK